MTKENFKTILIPSPWQIAACMLVSILIIVAVYWNTLIDIIAKNSSTSASTLADSLASYLSSFSTLPFTGNIFIILFWGVLAVAVYCTGLILANVLIDMRNSVVVTTKFTKPAGASKGVSRFLVQLGAALALVGLLVVCGTIVFPFFIQMVGSALLAGFSLSALASAVVGICGNAAALYLIWSLAQVVFKLL